MIAYSFEDLDREALRQKTVSDAGWVFAGHRPDISSWPSEQIYFARHDPLRNMV